MTGDALARGDKKATFGLPKVSKEKWDRIWEAKQTDEELLHIAQEVIRRAFGKIDTLADVGRVFNALKKSKSEREENGNY